MKVGIIRLPHSVGLDLPSYQTAGASGMDLAAAIDDNNSVTLAPGERILIPTGFIFEIPQFYELQIRPRSGLALKHGITVLNAPGTIDSDYRGELKVILINLSREEFTIHRGLRIAQAIFAPVQHITLEERSALTSETKRGTGGFGSTGEMN